jgi:hypothetical protein
MANCLRWTFICLVCCSLSFAASDSSVFELFAKGSASKSYISLDNNTISVSATAGLAITLIPRVRLEGRYTNITSLQNSLSIANVGTLNDIKTETFIYSAGLDIDILGTKSAFRPFIYLGAGYLESKRSYYFTLSGENDSIFHSEPKETGISANVGLGFRLIIAKALAFEIEVFGYAMDVDKPQPLVNLYGTAGVRIFI